MEETDWYLLCEYEDLKEIQISEICNCKLFSVHYSVNVHSLFILVTGVTLFYIFILFYTSSCWERF
jgi:hypothetical protein